MSWVSLVIGRIDIQRIVGFSRLSLLLDYHVKYMLGSSRDGVRFCWSVGSPHFTVTAWLYRTYF